MKFIYGLVDPRNRQIRYIGQTDDLPKRLQQHIMDKSLTPKTEWIKGLLVSNLKPEIIQLERVNDDDNAHMAEYRWVYFGRKNGWELTNTVGMKSEDYYSLQGYFERLIVEMEKPEDVPSKQPTMDDAKQELINVLVYSIRGIYGLPRFIKSTYAAIIAYVIALAWCILQMSLIANFDKSGPAIIGILASIFSAVVSGILFIGSFNEKDESITSIAMVIYIIAISEFLIGTIIRIAN